MPDTPDYLSATEAAKRYGVSEKTVRRYVTQGKLHSEKRLVAGRWQHLIARSELERLLSSSPESTMPPLPDTPATPDNHALSEQIAALEQRVTDLENRLTILAAQLITPPSPAPEQYAARIAPAPPANRRIQTDQDTSAPGWRERRKSSKPQLPDGWSSWNGFITRHGVRIDQQDIKALNRANYCEPGEYLDGRFTVAHALSLDGQRRLWQTLAGIPTLASKLHLCDVASCPCHGEQT